MLECVDVASCIMEHLEPASIVALARVGRGVRAAQRGAIRGTPRLLVAAACNVGALTKTQLMGWFALTSAEANTLPRARYVRMRGSGFYFLYREGAFELALSAILKGADEWEARVRARGATPDADRSTDARCCCLRLVERREQAEEAVWLRTSGSV